MTDCPEKLIMKSWVGFCMTAFYLKGKVQNQVRKDLDSELREREEDDPTKQTKTEFRISGHTQVFPLCFPLLHIMTYVYHSTS